MEKLLINENKDRAESEISNLSQRGKAVTSVIHFWNSQPALKPIITAKGVSGLLERSSHLFGQSCHL